MSRLTSKFYFTDECIVEQIFVIHPGYIPIPDKRIEYHKLADMEEFIDDLPDELIDNIYYYFFDKETEDFCKST